MASSNGRRAHETGQPRGTGAMSVQPAHVLDRLFTPGARLGWIFRDPRQLTAPFPESAPDPEHARETVAARAAAAQASYARARRWLVKPSLAAGLTLGLLAGYEAGRHHPAAAAVIGVVALLAAGSGLGYTARTWWRQRQADAAEPEWEYRQAQDAWQQRADAHRPDRRLRRQPDRLAGAAGRARHVPADRPAAAGGRPVRSAGQRPADRGRPGRAGPWRLVRAARRPEPERAADPAVRGPVRRRADRGHPRRSRGRGSRDPNRPRRRRPHHRAARRRPRRPCQPGPAGRRRRRRARPPRPARPAQPA